MADHDYKVSISRTPRGFLASVEEIKGCFVAGKTFPEMVANLRQEISLQLESSWTVEGISLPRSASDWALNLHTEHLTVTVKVVLSPREPPPGLR